MKRLTLIALSLGLGSAALAQQPGSSIPEPTRLAPGQHTTTTVAPNAPHATVADAVQGAQAVLKLQQKGADGSNNPDYQALVNALNESRSVWDEGTSTQANIPAGAAQDLASQAERSRSAFEEGAKEGPNTRDFVTDAAVAWGKEARIILETALLETSTDPLPVAYSKLLSAVKRAVLASHNRPETLTRWILNRSLKVVAQIDNPKKADRFTPGNLDIAVYILRTSIHMALGYWDNNIEHVRYRKAADGRFEYDYAAFGEQYVTELLGMSKSVQSSRAEYAIAYKAVQFLTADMTEQTDQAQDYAPFVLQMLHQLSQAPQPDKVGGTTATKYTPKLWRIVKQAFQLIHNVYGATPVEKAEQERAAAESRILQERANAEDRPRYVVRQRTAADFAPYQHVYDLRGTRCGMIKAVKPQISVLWDDGTTYSRPEELFHAVRNSSSGLTPGLTVNDGKGRTGAVCVLLESGWDLVAWGAKSCGMPLDSCASNLKELSPEPDSHLTHTNSGPGGVVRPVGL
jgi:hypothetical protein